jgi:hypothetical protein
MATVEDHSLAAPDIKTSCRYRSQVIVLLTHV